MSTYEAYLEFTARKEQLLRGWIAYAALCNPNSFGLSLDFLHATFGEWVHRAPQLVERDAGIWVLQG